MAIEGTKKTLEITPQTRTRVIVIETPYGGSPKLTAHREIVNRDNEGNVVSRDNALEVSRDYALVTSDPMELSDGTKVSKAHVAEWLSRSIDGWEIENKNKETP